MKNTQRANAARIMEKGLVGKVPAKTRTSPGPVKQANMGAMGPMNDAGVAPAAMPMKRGGSPKCYAKGGAHSDEKQDKALFKKMFKAAEAKEPKGMAAGGAGKVRKGEATPAGKPIAPPKRTRGLM